MSTRNTEKNQNLLRSFYFGSLSEPERLQVERELLCDNEVLVEYLDLKRQLEAAEILPQTPSPQLWQRLSIQWDKKKVWVFSLGLALAASLALLFVFKFQPSTGPTLDPSPVPTEILFDSSAELPVSSHVL